MWSYKRFKSYEMFYDRIRKRLPFKTDDCLIEVTAWAGLTVYLDTSTIYIKAICVMLSWIIANNEFFANS